MPLKRKVFVEALFFLGMDHLSDERQKHRFLENDICCHHFVPVRNLSHIKNSQTGVYQKTFVSTPKSLLHIYETGLIFYEKPFL